MIKALQKKVIIILQKRFQNIKCKQQGFFMNKQKKISAKSGVNEINQLLEHPRGHVPIVFKT